MDAYTTKRRMEGCRGWLTVARLIGTLISVFACLNLYADVADNVVITKWPMVRNMLTHATRLAPKTGATEPKAATPIHVSNAIQQLRDAGRTDVAIGLILCWYTAQRPCDVVLLKRRHLQHNADSFYVTRFGEG